MLVRPSQTFWTWLRPGAVVGAEAHEEIGGEDRAEEHDLGGEEEPDAELAVVEAGIGARGECVGNFHERY